MGIAQSAQITPDGTLSNNSIVTPHARIRSAVESSVRSKRPIPALLDISGRWMLVDIKNLLVPVCVGYRGQKASQFIITGRGGLPPSPSEPFRSDAVRVDLGPPTQGRENGASAAIPTNPTSFETTQIVEAQGWVIGANGEVMLTARPPTVTPHSHWMTTADCHTPETSS